MKRERPRGHHEVILEYPLTGLVDGWYFRQQEISAGCFLVEGTDLYGRSVSIRTVEPESALEECVAYARRVGFS